MSKEINHTKISELLTTIAKELGTTIESGFLSRPWHLCIMTSANGFISSIIAEKEGSPPRFRLYAIVEHNGVRSCNLIDGYIVRRKIPQRLQLNPTKSSQRHKLMEPLIQALYQELTPCAHQGEIIIPSHTK